MKLSFDRSSDFREDLRTPDNGFTISSPCEPNGSGELKCETVRAYEEIGGFHAIKMSILSPQIQEDFDMYVETLLNTILTDFIRLEVHLQYTCRLS